MLKGAMHVHSTYSDGEFTLQELREAFLADGCSFVCISDHADYFNNETVKQYAEDLARHSDDRFRFVMGLEYTCERNLHMLGYGASTLATTREPQLVMQQIRAQGAIPVIAHPKDEFFPWIESWETLPKGIEAWNSKYDGRYAPRPSTFALIERLRRREPQLQAFYGQDLHWRNQFRGLFVMVESSTLNSSAILSALNQGAYTAHKDNLDFASTGVLADDLKAEFARAQLHSRRVWQFFKNGKAMLDRVGIRVPQSLKAQLRRIF
jgi:PHP domain